MANVQCNCGSTSFATNTVHYTTSAAGLFTTRKNIRFTGRCTRCRRTTTEIVARNVPADTDPLSYWRQH